MVYIEDENIDVELNETLQKIFKCALKETNQTYDKLTCSLSFVSEEEIQNVNREQRGIDKKTDVLSFPYLNLKDGEFINVQNYKYDIDEATGELLIGDILICKDVAKSQAEEYGHSYNREICYLFTHGVMHLLGYDHMEEEDKKKMREKEELVLGTLGINR